MSTSQLRLSIENGHNQTYNTHRFETSSKGDAKGVGIITEVSAKRSVLILYFPLPPMNKSKSS